MRLRKRHDGPTRGGAEVTRDLYVQGLNGGTMRRFAILAACMCTWSCTRTAHSVSSGAIAIAPNEWRSLFDGRTLHGWHGLGYKEMPAGLWVVEDGAIKHASKGKGPL